VSVLGGQPSQRSLPEPAEDADRLDVGQDLRAFLEKNKDELKLKQK